MITLEKQCEDASIDYHICCGYVASIFGIG